MARPRKTDDDALLQAAIRVFWRHGFASTGIRELESTLGLRAPAIYHRFGSKEALFLVVLDAYVQQVVEARIRTYLQSERYAAAPLAGLRRFFDTTYEYIGPDNAPLACLLVNTSVEPVGHSPAITAALEAAGARVRHAFADTLGRAVDQGKLRADVDPGSLADAFYLGLQGLLVTSRIVRDPQRLSRQVDHLFALLPVTALSADNNPVTAHPTEDHDHGISSHPG
jgi:TetR/AcrR family transcriptional repressor of nem operon